MPPKAMQQVVTDSTNPTTTRPNLNPVTKTSSSFILINLPPFHSRKPMTLAKAYKYIGIRIYIGIYKENKAKSLRRFEALHTSFRLCTSNPDHDFKAVFNRLEPLNTHIRETSRKLWIPGRDITINKAMSRYQGRSKDILKILEKPIDRALDTNTSSAVVAHLIEKLPNQSKSNVVYLNNLFTNIKLLQYSKKRVLSISTYSNTQKKIKKLRKRPSETSTSAKTARNQLKKPNSIQRICKIGNTAITNAYKLSYHSEFRTKLVRRCFAFTRESHRKRKRSKIFVVDEYSKECVIYLKKGVSRAIKRKILGELSTNIPPNVKRSGYKKKSIFSYKICIVSLYKNNTCFTRYHSTK
ncbi:hypothetical protein DL98DRAFT_515342 [Cadophora sp. DSE1049]|nr:hypothetical protein DL98DRAFT_515342 [Cadophora sp. DSE1049]